jgi:glycosyltransferase involved in cell wall biosynthesis
MNPVRILVDSFADEGFPNAQMTNAREIIVRLDPARFHVSLFCVGKPDAAVLRRPNTRLIQLPTRRQTVKMFKQFLLGDHRILFYLKSSPASRLYMGLRQGWDSRVTVGTVESQSDLRNEPTISAENVRLWEKTVLRCDYLFSNSRRVQQSLEGEYGLRSEIVPTGVDTRFFLPAENRKPNPRTKVLFVGSLRPFKQPNLLLDAAVRYPYADFLLAGEGMMAGELRNRVAREQLTNVSLLGLLDSETLRQHYQSSDIFLFPSTWEGSPKVMLEAAACGLPVIARKNYEPETVIDGVTGYLARSDSELFTRMEGLLHNPAMRCQLGEAARKHSQRFDWGVITGQWEAIVDRLSSRKARG